MFDQADGAQSSTLQGAVDGRTTNAEMLGGGVDFFVVSGVLGKTTKGGLDVLSKTTEWDCRRSWTSLRPRAGRISPFTPTWSNVTDTPCSY